MFHRILEKSIHDDFFSGKIIMILGPRQVGKTTLVETILSSFSVSDIVSFSGDNIDDRENLSINSLGKLSLFVEDKKIIFIDEAQKIENIGDTLKLLLDHYKNTKQIIITGSSSINILDKTHEPLTGRKNIYYMYPISSGEVFQTRGAKYIDDTFEQFLLYGMYPEVLMTPTREGKIRLLSDLSGATLYRDILEFQQVKNSSVIIKLLKLIALQIGKEVSIHELAITLAVDAKTIERYIDLLEKSFLIFRLPPYFTNKRKELNKSNKIYFWDLGIRNALLHDFNSIDSRRDIGDIWENFLIVERLKYMSYSGHHANIYFWRSYSQQEIDYIEEINGILYTYEYKWGNKKAHIPKLFGDTYPDTIFRKIDRSNYLPFILGMDDKLF